MVKAGLGVNSPHDRFVVPVPCRHPEGVYSPLLTLMAFFFPAVDADHWYPVVRLVWSVNSIFSPGINRT